MIGRVALATSLLAGAGAASPPVEIARVPFGELQAFAPAGGRLVLALRTDVGARVVSTSRSRTRVLLELRRPESPPETADERPTVDQHLQIEASASRVAVLRDVGVWWAPRCSPRCRGSGRYDPIVTEVYVGSPTARLRRVFRVVYDGRRCAAAPAYLAVSGSTVAYATVTREWRRCPEAYPQSSINIVAGNRTPRRRAIALAPGTQITSLALAGRYLAWGERRDGVCPSCSGIVLRDWKTGATKLHYSKLRFGPPHEREVALQPDGSLALVLPIRRNGCARSEIALVPTGARVPRFTGTPARWIGGMAGGRVVAFGIAECRGHWMRLTVTDLGGRSRILRIVSLEPYWLDFDGGHIVYALPTRLTADPPTSIYRQRVP